MTIQRTSRFKNFRNPVLLTNEAVSRLEQQLQQHQWGFSSAELERKGGQSLTRLSMDELKALDETWWIECEELKLTFAHAVVNGSASLTFKTPHNVLPGGTSSQIFCSDFGASLAVEQEFSRFVEVNSLGYGLFSWPSFWVVLALFPCSTAARVLFFRGAQLPPHLDTALASIHLLGLFMFLYGAKKIFPKVQFALGTASRKNAEQRRSIRRVFHIGWEILKVVIPAVLGAIVGAWWQGHYGKSR